MKELKGKITISRVQGSNLTESVWIEITDEMSGCRLLKVMAEPAIFAEALLGLAYQPCSLEYYAECPAGKKRQVKTELLPRPKDVKYAYRKEAGREMLEPYEVDGWEGSVDDLFNHHRWRQADKVEVGFHRFVDVEA